MPTYNEDMMHCLQTECKKRNKCYRYWLGKRANGLVSMYRPTNFNNVVNCQFFLNINDW